MPSSVYTPPSSAASGSGSSASTYAGAPVLRTSSVPKPRGSGRNSVTGTPSTVTPSAERSVRSTTVTICGSRSNASRTSAGRAVGTTTARSNDEIRPAARVPGHLPAERLGDPADEISSGVQRQPAPRPIRLRVQALEDPALGRRVRCPARAAARPRARSGGSPRGSRRRGRPRCPASASARCRAGGRARRAPVEPGCGARPARRSSRSLQARAVARRSPGRFPAARARDPRGRAP